MMKKKILCIVLMIAMLVPVTACGKKATVDSIFKDSEKALSKVDSFESEMIFDLDMSIEVDTVSLGIELAAEMNAEVTEDAIHLSGDMDVQIPMQGSEKFDFEMYAINEKDSYTVYASDGSEWAQVLIEDDDYDDVSKILEKFTPEEFMILLSDYADEFELEKKLEKVNKSDAYVLKGNIDGMMLIDAIKESDLDVSVEDIEEMLESLADEGIDLEDYEAEVTIWIDKKSSLPAYIEIDFAGMLTSVMKDVMAIYEDSMSAGEGSMQNMNIKFDVKTAMVTVAFSSVNKVDEIEVPKKVKDAAVEVQMDEDDILGYVDDYSMPI